ncbi:hypothetical protein [Azospirillum sp.]|uniref:hypothetical protein n=1 Tax=Azospirillum sp. TaxID=34012 RepID=UPI002D738192|nr:hypothetical protein [Azospirillum sp.]HYD66876.1 hypothetical protein [Azospirillum sp.]
MTTATAFAEAPGQRRHRRPDQPVAGHPEIPTFDRHDALTRAARRGTPPMGRVLHMAATGVWAIRLGGRFVEVDGRHCWESREDLDAAAVRAGVALSDLVVDTGR